MIAQLLYLAGTQAIVSDVVPTISSFNLTSTDGFCGSSFATNELNWSVANPNDVAYEIHIVRDGILYATLFSSETSYSDNIGLVYTTELIGSVYLTYNFDVNLVRISDATVLQTLSASRSDFYKSC